MLGVTPAEAFTRLARAARWHRRSLGTVAAVICLFAVLTLLAPAKPETALALVASHPHAAGTLLTETDLRVSEIPLDYLPEGALGDSAEAVGRTLTGALTAGSVLTTASTLSGRDGSAGPNERLVPFRVPDATTGALLQVGELHQRRVEDDALRIPYLGDRFNHGVILCFTPAKASVASQRQAKTRNLTNPVQPLTQPLSVCPCYGEKSQEGIEEVCLVGLYLLSWISCP